MKMNTELLIIEAWWNCYCSALQSAPFKSKFAIKGKPENHIVTSQCSPHIALSTKKRYNGVRMENFYSCGILNRLGDY